MPALSRAQHFRVGLIRSQPVVEDQARQRQRGCDQKQATIRSSSGTDASFKTYAVYPDHLPASSESNVLTMNVISAEYGADPNVNTRLAQAIATAKKAGFPKSSIESAIARGQGVSASGAALETLTLEAIMPTSVATVIDCQTDSKARTLSSIRLLIREHRGTVTPTSYLFEKKGKIVFERAEGLGVDEILDEAVEAGAMDVEEDDQGRVVVYTEPSQTKSAAEGLTAAKGLKVESSDIIWDPNQDTMVELSSEKDAQNLDNFLQAVHEDPSVQNVYLNVA